MPIFSVKHAAVYRHARQVRFGEHRLMFQPRDSVRTISLIGRPCSK